MKKANFIMSCCLILAACMTGCSEENEYGSFVESRIEPSSHLVLEAPNGEMIATDLSALKKETEELIARQFGDDFDFEITGIEYASPSDGYLALVTYCLEDGRSSSYVKTNSAEVLGSLSADQLILGGNHTEYTWEWNEEKVLIHSQVETRTGSVPPVRAVCKSDSNCKPCQVKVVQRPPAGNKPSPIKVSCTRNCTDCTMEVTIG